MADPTHELPFSGAASDAGARDIAVIGMAGRFPGGRDLEAFWQSLAAGRAAGRSLTEAELRAAGVPEKTLARPDYVRTASLLEGVDEFDAELFGYTPREAAILDPQQRLFLEHAWAALEDAGYAPRRFPGLIGVYAGVAWNTYLLSNLMSHRELFDGAGAFQVFITNDKDFMPTRVAYKLNLKGPALIVQTSCSTSLVATHLACLALQSYECDLALAGGVTVKVPDHVGYFYEEGGLASPDGVCRPFDAKAAGTIFGSGIGIVALKRLDEALADGDSIRAVIRGSAINNDGSTKVSYTAPSVEGQAEVIAAAQAMAGVDPASISYVECHGTGTSLGDPIEVRALTKAFGETPRRNFCALGSVKSNVGHLDAAAGVAGLIKTVMALEHELIPPSLHFEEPNPAIDFAASPFFVAAEPRPWPRTAAAPRRAGVSSFGVGGTNAHVVVEEAPVPAPSGPARRLQLLRLSAGSEAALERLSARLAAHLANTSAPLADVAHTLAVGRETLGARRVVVAESPAEAAALLAAGASERVLSATDSFEPRPRPIAFLFSGQGSQYPGMAKELREEPAFRAAFERTAAAFRPHLDRDLTELLWPAEPSPEAASELARTRYTQPALFALEWALAELWESWGVVPQAYLGHSLGEYVAACRAGVFSLEEAARLVAVRARLMDALPAGAMLGVPLGEQEALALLAAHPELSLAAINEPGRVVVSGPFAAIEAFEAELAGQGVPARRLHTSHAFHSAMMEPMLGSFEAELRAVRWAAPTRPWVSNLTGDWIAAEQATDPRYWLAHLRQPVRFADGVATLAADPERVFLEVGPGRTLATLASRHPARRPEQAVVASLPHPTATQATATSEAADALAFALTALGRLWLAGVDLDPSALHAGETRRRVPLPTYPFEPTKHWIAAGELVASTARAPLAGKRPALEDWFALPSWKPTLPGAPRAEGLPGSVLLVGEQVELLAAVAARLRAAGVRVVAAGGAGETSHPAWWTALLAGEAADVDHVVLATALDREPLPPAFGAAELAHEEGRGLGALLALAQAVGQAGRTKLGVTVVADALVRVVPGEPLRPEKAPLLGLARVVPQELAGVALKVVDLGLAPLAQQVEALVAELGTQDEAELVALRGGRRFVESFEPVPLPSGTSVLRERGVYLVTGGLVGNGHAFALHLARTRQARLVLVEPAGSFDRAAEPRLARLTELGAEVLAVEADVAEPAGWRKAFEAAERRFGTVHGIVHAAGTDGERTFRALAEIDAEHLSWHFGPKVAGTLALDAALDGRPELAPDFVLLLSSLASVLGGLAYGAYAAANAFLDALAEERRERTGRPWLALGWDVWRFDHEERQITELRADLAELAMSPREGEQAFERALAAGAGPLGVARLLVSTADLGERRAERRRRIAGHAPAPAVAGPRHPRPALATPFVPLEGELEQRVAAVWQQHLGLAEIGAHDNFFELGGDSFLAVRVAAGLREALGTELPVAELYQRLTVRALAGYVAEQSTTNAEERHAAELAERRESMDRRRELMQKRRDRRQVTVE